MPECQYCSESFFFSYRLRRHLASCPTLLNWVAVECPRCGHRADTLDEERSHRSVCRMAPERETSVQERRERRQRGLEQYRREQAEIQRRRAESQAQEEAERRRREELAASRQRSLDGLVLAYFGPRGDLPLTLTLDLSEAYPWSVGLALGGSPLTLTGDSLPLGVAEIFRRVIEGENLNIGREDSSGRHRIEANRFLVKFDISRRISSDLPGEDTWHTVTIQVDPEESSATVSEYFDAGH